LSDRALSLAALTSTLNTRASRAVLGHLSLRSDALREHLRDTFELSPGEPTSFLADPVIESAFGYEECSETMADLSGTLIEPEVLRALDQPPKEFREQRFASTWHPYRHQQAAWAAAADPKVRGFIISSGTGSGKTEGFLVPILNDLVRESRQVGQVVGVRALFLYPLNALINSQRDRLRAWTRSFGGDIRYCLYNGETPSEVKARDQSEAPEQVLSRALLRKSPPPILVTNATMLEYMLVRRADAPILTQSRHKLRWIVIDEAHTYIGSQAAELSMLLRRVIDAFGVDRGSVKFIATSATLGGHGADGRESLAEYLADLAGTAADRVAVITGRRAIPKLDKIYTSREEDIEASLLCQGDAPASYETLASSRWFRALRDYITEKPRTLSDICEQANRLNPADARWSRREILQLLDCAANATNNDQRLLPIRCHYFHRTQNGAWACLNASCSGRTASRLDNAAWPFGAVYFTRREECKHCQSLVFELVRCADCGSVYLAAVEVVRQAGRFLSAVEALRQDEEADDEFDLIDLDDESIETAPTDEHRLPRLIAMNVAGDWSAACTVDVQSGKILEDSATGQLVQVILRDDRDVLRCGTCGEPERRPADLFRPLRMGAPYLLNVAIPTLLEETAPMSRPGSRPLDGRRLITFSDSRQGTARFAVRSQLDADRNHVRSCIYHQVISSRQPPSTDAVDALREEIRVLEGVGNGALATILRERRSKLDALLSPGDPQMEWSDVADSLDNDVAIREWMPGVWEHLSFGEIRKLNFGDFCTLRELLRRPRLQNSLETLGLVGLAYPEIERTPDHRTPAAWIDRGLSAADWRSFLTTIVDHFLRARTTVDVPKLFLNWLGATIRTRYVLAPRSEKTNDRQVPWPRTASVRSTMPRLLAAALQAPLDDADNRRLIDMLLEGAWDAIRPMLKPFADGYLLDLHEQASITAVTHASICPLTGRLLRSTLRGITPYLSQFSGAATIHCSPVRMPQVPHAWWREPSGRTWSRSDIVDWLNTDERIVELRGRGIWTDLHDRIVSVAPYYRVAEHSAQQEGSRLREYEDQFRDGFINVMSCSTTMEMGVDIGGISAVAMNNAPPSPANFLQRAGRAGRRGEGVTVSLTLCKSDPHGESVFANPLWPFVTPIFVPRVSLDSDRVIQRHANSFLLSEFFRTDAGADPPHLTTGWFFAEGADNSAAGAFVAWLREEQKDDHLFERLRRLLSGSGLSTHPLEDVFASTVEALGEIEKEWKEELAALDDDIARFASTTTTSTPAQLSATRQRERLVDEYLLRELTTRGFLPGYGFPSDVIPFIPTTLKQLRSERRGENRGREDSAARRRGYPSRQLRLAIRDYAPGNQVVLDGRVFKSEGVTLNWHIPPGDQFVRETQVFEHAWRCKMCGASGTSKTVPLKCSGCQAEAAFLDDHIYLQPAGFAVGITYDPHNQVSSHLFIPVEEPWITAGDVAWIDIDRPLRARLRSSHSGHVFHFSRGLFSDH
jgi:ATP-dependent helicase YprA (DUF1998 family)